MTKNVVQRLQTIQQDINSIISIYDLTTKPKKSDEEFESQKNQSTCNLAEMDSPECSESAIFSNTLQHQSSTSFAPVTKSGSFFTRSFKTISSDDSIPAPGGGSHKWSQPKPGSAPTSSSRVHQSDYIWRRSLLFSRNVPERRDLPKAKTYDTSCQTVWYDCKSSTDFKAAKTLVEDVEFNNDEPPVKNNYEENEEHIDSMLEFDESASKFETIKREDSKVLEKQKTDSVKSTASFKEENENENSVTGERSPAKPQERPNSIKCSISTFPTSSTTPKTPPSLKQEKPLEHFTKYPTKVSRGVKPRTPSPDARNNKPIMKAASCKVKKDEDGTNDRSSNMKLSERINFRVRQEEKFLGDRSDEKTVEKEKKLRINCNNQKAPKGVGEDSIDLVINETNAIISKSLEKLEKMKSSKELALNLAKQLKDKCDELRVSNQELTEKLQRVEKENKRLSNGMKATELTRKKLQSRFEELKNESKIKLTEHEMKTKKLEEEINSLKSKIQEKEKQHNEELHRKQKEVDQGQKERLHEIRNAMKVRESSMGEIQRLTNEKSDLQTRIEELKDLLNQSHKKKEKLEEENRRLQELQSQNDELEKKKKTEEAQQELESIRLHSKDLEEQVKTLRKSVESFDEVQQRLVKQTTEYQQQMLSGLEEIEKLRNENAKLKASLENEKDSLLIKNKIIEDQQETIKQLKAKTEEVKTLLKKNQSLERILDIEREEKLELEEAVEHLNRRKEELKQKIKCLENDLLLAPQEVVRDLQKTQVVLHELENQVQAKQKEWEFHLQCLIRQKEQACSVAEFATKKLMRTTTEFQKQMEAYKALQRTVAENMTLKENLTCPANFQVGTFPSRSESLQVSYTNNRQNKFKEDSKGPDQLHNSSDKHAALRPKLTKSPLLLPFVNKVLSNGKLVVNKKL